MRKTPNVKGSPIKTHGLLFLVVYVLAALDPMSDAASSFDLLVTGSSLSLLVLAFVVREPWSHVLLGGGLAVTAGLALRGSWVPDLVGDGLGVGLAGLCAFGAWQILHGRFVSESV